MIEKARDLYLHDDKNCAESVFLAACSDNGLDMNKAVKAVSVFGGGLASGRLCGAVAGGACAIGMKYCGENAHGSPEMRERLKAYMTESVEFFGSDLCFEIKPKYFREDGRCLEVIVKAAELSKKYLR